MSVNHQKRIEGVVNEALNKAALGEAYGFVVSPPSFWPFLDETGKPVGRGPAWCVTVTIRASGLGEPDVVNGFPVPGFMPADDSFRTVATRLLEANRQQRDAQKDNELAQARAAFQQSMERRGE